ncbi:Flavinator of succinate dehydrogenase [Legionella bozemanae]|uniref:FAD assembly factor SdhE n=2 Tax=Legionella bozemanae TaxID=447 RepID=A0A0W0S3M8_LEGBO|nr:Antitoxin CptB [Legionella bozemanae]STO33912.1 Flavinator of succinate dehydrogenase [Legionella bozemanae]
MISVYKDSSVLCARNLIIRDLPMLDPKEKTRLAWHCRRGMLELDLILQHFLEHQLVHLSVKELEAFNSLLSCTDPELFAWLMGHEDPQDKELKKIVAIIRNSN